jgi:hypothetical protein
VDVKLLVGIGVLLAGTVAAVLLIGRSRDAEERTKREAEMQNARIEFVAAVRRHPGVEAVWLDGNAQDVLVVRIPDCDRPALDRLNGSVGGMLKGFRFTAIRCADGDAQLVIPRD